MGWFKNSVAGEWAAIAMGCMAFADGVVEQSELKAAEVQVSSNPVFTESDWSDKALALFQSTVEAIRPVPTSMLHTYEAKLAELAGKIKDPNDRNYALTAVIAVSMGGSGLNQAEHDMALRFKEALQATIPIPAAGAASPSQQAVAAATAAEPVAAARASATEQVSATADASGAHAAGSAEAQPAAAAASVQCATCHKPVQFYEGYGHWCVECQQYTMAQA